MQIPLNAYCISLPETPERTEKAAAHFKERGVNVKFFEGIHAEKFGLRTVFPYEVDNPGSGWNIGYKPTGIWLSHYMLWGALNLLYDEYFTIAESDCLFPENWKSVLNDAFKYLPRDFDLFYIGNCCCAQMPKKLVGGQVWEVNYPMCTHAYIVAKKALPVLLKTQRKVYAPIDISIGLHSAPLLKVLALLPSMCSQLDTVLQP